MTKRKRNPWKIAFICLLAAILAVGGFFAYLWLASAIPYWLVKRQQGEPDRLNDSWGNINQDIEKQAGWEQIVDESAFHMGQYGPVLGAHTTENGDSVLAQPTYPVIDGSTVMLRMAAEFVWQHLRLEGKAALRFTDFSTTSAAYERLFNPWDIAQYPINENYVESGRPVDLFLGTAPGEGELEIARQNGVTPVMKPICWDGFVFITHKDNPIDSLTIEQIQGIYSGSITNWSEVGGEDKAIRAYQREAGSGSQTGMLSLVMQGIPMADPGTVKEIIGMGELVSVVAEYQNDTASLGYTYRYYIDTLYKNPDIKTLKINGTAPTNENIVSGSYPLRTNYYGVIRQGDESAPGGKFLDWILSEEGQKCVQQAGYIRLEN